MPQPTYAPYEAHIMQSQIPPPQKEKKKKERRVDSAPNRNEHQEYFLGVKAAGV